MRQSEKKILINNFLMLLLVVCGVVLLGVASMAIDKIIAIIVIAVALGLIK